MSEGEKKKSDCSFFAEAFLIVGAADIAAVLMNFIFRLLLLPFGRELEARGKVAVWDCLTAWLCVLSFFCVLAVLVLKNSGKRSRWLNKMYGKTYRRTEDLKNLAVEETLPYFIAAAVVGAPLYVIFLIFGEMNYLPTLFAPYDAFCTLTGNVIIGWVTVSCAVPLFMLVVTFAAHEIWYRKRLRR